MICGERVVVEVCFGGIPIQVVVRWWGWERLIAREFGTMDLRLVQVPVHVTYPSGKSRGGRVGIRRARRQDGQYPCKLKMRHGYMYLSMYLVHKI